MNIQGLDWGDVLVFLGTVAAAFLAGAWASHSKSRETMVQREKVLIDGYNSLVQQLREEVDRLTAKVGAMEPLATKVEALQAEVARLNGVVEEQRRYIEQLLPRATPGTNGGF